MIVFQCSTIKDHLKLPIVKQKIPSFFLFFFFTHYTITLEDWKNFSYIYFNTMEQLSFFQEMTLIFTKGSDKRLLNSKRCFQAQYKSSFDIFHIFTYSKLFLIIIFCIFIFVAVNCNISWSVSAFQVSPREYIYIYIYIYIYKREDPFIVLSLDNYHDNILIKNWCNLLWFPYSMNIHIPISRGNKSRGELLLLAENPPFELDFKLVSPNIFAWTYA